MKKLKIFCTIVLLSISVLGGSAQAVSLQDLFDGVDGGVIVAGDKQFDQWTLNYVETDMIDGGITPLPDLGNIDVNPLHDGGLNPGPGLSFDTNDELFVVGDGFFSFIDLSFSFRAVVLDPFLKIKDNSLEIVRATFDDFGKGDSGVGITEEILDLQGNELGFKDVSVDIFEGELSANPFDSAAFHPQTEIFITKNILVWATELEETASLDVFEQRFSQVPEPSIILLIAAGGLMGFAFRSKRRA